MALSMYVASSFNTPQTLLACTQESVSVICHDSGFGDRVIVGDEGVEKYKERIRVARKILAEVNQTLQGRTRERVHLVVCYRVFRQFEEFELTWLFCCLSNFGLDFGRNGFTTGQGDGIFKIHVNSRQVYGLIGHPVHIQNVVQHGALNVHCDTTALFLRETFSRYGVITGYFTLRRIGGQMNDCNCVSYKQYI